MADRPSVILLVEDNPDHAELVVRALEGHRLVERVQLANDGEEALDYLRHRGAWNQADPSPRPHLILLDLRLPKLDGLEVLREVKSDHDLHTIPVVVLTTSEKPSDAEEAYACHVNSYLVKPADFAGFSRMMSDLCQYWLSWNRRPGDPVVKE